MSTHGKVPQFLLPWDQSIYWRLLQKWYRTRRLVCTFNFIGHIEVTCKMAWLRFVSLILVCAQLGSCLPAQDEERSFTSAVARFASTVLHQSIHDLDHNKSPVLKIFETVINNFLAQGSAHANIYKVAAQELNQTTSRERRSVFKLLDNSRRYKPFGFGYTLTYPFLSIRVPTTKLTWMFWTQPCPTAKV